MPRCPQAIIATQPPVCASHEITDHASPAEISSVIDELQQKWRERGHDMKAAGKHTDGGIGLRIQRTEINAVITQLEEGTLTLPLFRSQDVPAIPLLKEVEARYRAANEEAQEAWQQWEREARAHVDVDVSDAAWAAGYERGQQREAQDERTRLERKRWRAERREREQQTREDAIRRGVETRARRREQKFREAVQALRDHALTPGHSCRTCKKHLSDPASITRGVGPECWQHVLAAVERTTVPVIDMRGDCDGA